MKENDYVVRVWPSGKMTMGVVKYFHSELPYFYSLENYSLEGGVKNGEVYGGISSNSAYPQRLATPIEIEAFLSDGNLDNIKGHERNIKLVKLGIL